MQNWKANKGPHFLLDNSNPNRQYYCLLIVRPILFVSIDHLGYQERAVSAGGVSSANDVTATAEVATSSDGGASKYCVHQYYRSNQKAALRISHFHMGREETLK